MSKVLVIGGGAAGMMAALAAAECGNDVTLLEKNEKLGKKVYITGKGRCNVTNAADAETFFQNICRNKKFMYSAFYDYDNTSVMNFFEQADCPLKTERGDRVFPVSDHSSDIIFALQRELNKAGVRIILHTEVKELLTRDLPETEGKKKALCEITGVTLQSGKTMECDRVIVCTGGLSYPTTGSTGDGYRFARKTGHQIVEPAPALVPFEVKEEWCKTLTGLSLKNVSLKMLRNKKCVYENQGEMLFTHFGVSGPLVLSASSFYEAGTETMLYLDLKPALDEEQLDRRILRDFDENKNKQFKNSLNGLFPIKMIPIMISLSHIEPDKKINEITKEERQEFVKLIKNVPLTVTGTRGFAEAIITRGGISVKDVNPSTMESKLVNGLFFAGEVLDLDALTGGFNLQIAFSTGHLAGTNV